MEENTFKSFVKMLRLLENANNQKSSIDNAIVSLINSNETEMNDEQKLIITKRFISYQRNRKKEPGKPRGTLNLSSNDLY